MCRKAADLTASLFPPAWGALETPAHRSLVLSYFTMADAVGPSSISVMGCTPPEESK